jgi:hypothetical protein
MTSTAQPLEVDERDLGGWEKAPILEAGALMTFVRKICTMFRAEKELL